MNCLCCVFNKAWPARPQDTYGLEKLYAEEMAIAYAKDFPVKTRIARYHNVYGPRGDRMSELPLSLFCVCVDVLMCVCGCGLHRTAGTWKGGREKVPAAFCRKAVVSTSEFELWGDGLQTRSFMFIDDCVEGSIRIMLSDCHEPLNLGTDEMINMNDFARLAMSFEAKTLPIKHIPGPQGVRTLRDGCSYIIITYLHTYLHVYYNRFAAATATTR